ncbi:MAG: phosphoglycerate kinase [Deltaproteobacteria bacterium]|nr:phosphoglycerate kinase [Deltaproteobacteria bacterium]
MLKIIDQIDIREKRVFIRTDYNVSMKDGKIADDLRIRASLPTLQYAIDAKAKIIIGSHLGRPKGVRDEKYSLLPVAERLSELLGRDVIFPEDCIGDAVKKLASELRDGDVLLLENLRFHPEEEANEPFFSEKLAAFAEIYINDSFGTVHRAHASTAGMVSHFKEKGMGFLMQKELAALDGLFHAKKPFLAILGGAKVSDKIGVIENMMNHVDGFLIGGAMAYTFLKALGKKIGQSVVEEGKVHQAEKILKRAEVKGIEILLPPDSVIAFEPFEGTPFRIATNGEDWGNWMGLDIGPKTLDLFSERIMKAATIFWNGPMGMFEIPPFNRGTVEIANRVAQSGAFSIAGGGDSLAAIRQAGFGEKFSHLSTGGGASMEFLQGKTLAGLKALES